MQVGVQRLVLRSAHCVQEIFALADSHARSILREVAEAVSNWESVARGNGIAEAEIARFEPTLSSTIDAIRGGLRPGG